MNEYIEAGHIEKINPSEINNNNNKTLINYIPYHSVTNPNRPGKI